MKKNQSLKIQIKIIPHRLQRYNTIGDYWIEKNGTWQIRISKLGNWKYEMAVLIHELWEQALCFDKGIKEIDITNFDIKFEKERKKGNIDEPGNSLKAPYHKQHRSATKIEKSFISEVNENWEKYEKEINKMCP